MDDAQAESGGDGSIHAGALLTENAKTQRGAASHICHHGTLIKDLRQQRAPFLIMRDDLILSYANKIASSTNTTVSWS